MEITGFEIDVLPVGDGTQSGDAILSRFIKADGSQEIILVDGGFKDTADTIKDHLEEHYKTLQIDHMVCSHPDQDHIGGLEGVIEKCDVKKLWVNRPLDYVDEKRAMPIDHEVRFTQSHADKVEELIKLAEEKGILIGKPLQDAQIGPFIVCSPSPDFYGSLVKGNLQESSGREASWLTRAVNWVAANWFTDMLYEAPKTSDTNESSTVLFADICDRRILLTADAGVRALDESWQYLMGRGYKGNIADETEKTYVQVPHHGSRHNVNSDVLDKILGGKVSRETAHRGLGIVSVSEKAEENKDNPYPRRAVSNAFLRRGYPCFVTKTSILHCHTPNMPDRGWSPAERLPFFDEEEST